MRVRFTLSQLMVVIALLGFALGALAQVPRHITANLVVFMLPIALLAGTGYAVFLVSRLGLKYRLPIELVVLVGLLGLSSLIWRPVFYVCEEQRCRELARKASAASACDLETRMALDLEAGWFTRRASDLRWRGLWIGLTLGPKTRDTETMNERSLIYELGTIESVDKHERKLQTLLGVGPSLEE